MRFVDREVSYKENMFFSLYIDYDIISVNNIYVLYMHYTYIRYIHGKFYFTGSCKSMLSFCLM